MSKTVRKQIGKQTRNLVARHAPRCGAGAHAVRRESGAQALGMVEWMQQREERKGVK
ncbi:hypothetical protein UFOVP1304_47 [uncultured Caudovirales phage]|uniref:Uncharacterized protein n=1 Tax=uncultured Caudovirales phage TaxID=2100421 RepID=A0A6J5RIH3_9CAUD|nr:hypothetical protein UFOVP1304_47 [uncultured Caudovirales phage]